MSLNETPANSEDKRSGVKIKLLENLGSSNITPKEGLCLHKLLGKLTLIVSLF